MGFPQWLSGTESACNSGDIGDAVWSLGWEDPLEEEMASHSSILAWEIPWTKKPGGLSQTWLNTEWRKHWSIDSALWAQIMNHRDSVPISPLWGTLQTLFPRCKVNQMPWGPLGLILMELFCTPSWSLYEDWWGMTPCGQHSISFSRITSNGFSRMAVPNSRCWLGYQGSLANHGLEPCVWAYEWTPTHLCFNHNATSGLASKVLITLCISGHWPLVSHLSPLQTPCCTSDTSLAVAIPICPRI